MQSFVKRNFKTIFENDNCPKLLYVSKAESDLTKLPCVMHMHEDRLEILFIRQGRGIHTIGGRQYQTKRGDILIYNSGVLHDERTNPDTEMTVYNCAVSNLRIDGLRENCLLRDDVYPVLKSGELYYDIENIFRMLNSQIYSEHTGAEEICHNLLYALLTIILKQVDSHTQTEEDEENILTNRIKKYIDEHYYEEITLESISYAMNISISYMCHVFKKATAYSPIRYIMCRRIGKAQSLLISTQHSATEIAFLVGYDNSNYFNTIFTKTVGMSPIKYRNTWVKKTDR